MNDVIVNIIIFVFAEVGKSSQKMLQVQVKSDLIWKDF